MAVKLQQIPINLQKQWEGRRPISCNLQGSEVVELQNYQLSGESFHLFKWCQRENLDTKFSEAFFGSKVVQSLLELNQHKLALGTVGAEILVLPKKYSRCYKISEKYEMKKHKGKVPSARWAKLLNLFNTSPTTSSCNARENVAKSGEIRQRQTNRDESGGSR